MRQDLGTTLGIISVVLAVGSCFMCLPIAPLMAIGAIVASIFAIREGAVNWGVTGIILAVLALLACMFLSFCLFTGVFDI